MIFHLPWKTSKGNGKAFEDSNRDTCISDRLLPGRVGEAEPRPTPELAVTHSWEIAKNCAVLLATPYTAVAFISGAILGTSSTFIWRRWLRRIRTAEWVTPDILARRKWVKGVVTSVGDADNFRLYHMPGIGWHWPFKFRRVPTLNKDLKDQTIHIRIAGVDAPEGAHFGKPAQPHAEESLLWLRKRIEGRTVYCQLVRKDQYGRIIAVPLVSRRFLPTFLCKRWGSPLALEMLRSGMVTTYEQAGAEYGPWSREEFLRVEAEARASRRGMWKYGRVGETPAEYKKRHALLQTSSSSLLQR